MSKYTSIGGQALIEGIMMRGPKRTVMAVRTKEGEIDITEMSYTPIKEKYKILGWPLIRGAVNLVESMIQGYKAIELSAEKSGFADEDEPQQDGKESKSVAIGAVMIVAAVLAVILSVGLFMYLPALAFDGIVLLAGEQILPYAPIFEGLIRLIILIGYMFAVSLMKDIKRVFQYHGAEHKTIFCFENGKELTVENVRPEKRFHPRCGTSFLVLMVLVSIIVSSAIIVIFPSLRENTILWTSIKILLVPVICGIGYELIKICGRYDNLLTRIISAPGVWVQRITTREPDDDMIEIAIAAMKEVIPQEEKENEESDNL